MNQHCFVVFCLWHHDLDAQTSKALILLTVDTQPNTNDLIVASILQIIIQLVKNNNMNTIDFKTRITQIHKK